MIKSRQLRGHRRQPKTIVEELVYDVDESMVQMARSVGIQPELVGQYLFAQRANGQYGPGQALLHAADYSPQAGKYRLVGTHTRLA